MKINILGFYIHINKGKEGNCKGKKKSMREAYDGKTEFENSHCQASSVIIEDHINRIYQYYNAAGDLERRRRKHLGLAFLTDLKN